jgi:hypothetical protein
MPDVELPTYRFGEIPDGMATMTMLAGLRRRPRAGQPPVGWYPVKGGGKVPLYAVDDALELPAMSDKQHARWIANRTCARCGEIRADPVPLDQSHGAPEGRRIDYECKQLERLAGARAGWLKLRMQAVAWAWEVAFQPDLVILVGEVITGQAFNSSPVDLLAVDARSGEIIFDITTWPSPYRDLTTGGMEWPRYPRNVRDWPSGQRLAPGGRTVDCDDVVPYLARLVGRPVVYLTLRADGHPVGHVEHYSALWELHGLSLFAGNPMGATPHGEDAGNNFAVRWNDWLNQPTKSQTPWSGRTGLETKRVEADSPAAAVTLVRDRLRRMRLDEHPDGPALCPVLPDGVGVEPCGKAAATGGTCVGHDPA